MTLAFDSSTLIGVMRQAEPALMAAFRQMDLSRFRAVVPVVVMHELLSGAALAPNPLGERAKIDRILAGFDVVSLEAEDVESTALVRAELRRKGRPIGDIDTLIAGQALARSWTVVTSNVRHFGRVEGLPIIDWAVGPGALSPEVIASRVAEAF